MRFVLMRDVRRNFGVRVRVFVVDHESDCVRHDVGNRVERLDTSLCRAWRIQYKSVADGSADTAGQSPEGVHQSHCLGQTWRLPFDGEACPLRCEVPRTKTRAAGGDDHAVKPIGDPLERFTNRLSSVFCDRSLDDVVAELPEVFRENGSGAILPRAVHDPIGHGDDLGLGSVIGEIRHGDQWYLSARAGYDRRMDDDQVLRDCRDSIDNIDAALVHMLAERFKITKRVGEHKAAVGFAPADPDREAVQIARLRKLADSAGLDPTFSEKFLRFIVDEVIHHHNNAKG